MLTPLKHSSQFCPEGPQAMASCACIKSGMSAMASSLMSSSVKFYCESTASEDVVSVLSVFDFYCSAARKEVVATGVSESIGQDYATGDGVGAAPGPDKTGEGDGKDGDGSSKGISVAAIAGGVVGVVGILSIIGVLVFFMMKRRANLKKQPPIAYDRPPGTANGSPSALLSDKPELAGTPIAAPPLPPASPHPSIGKMGASRTDAVSPVSAYSNAQSAFTPPPPQAAELQSSGVPAGAPPMPELQGGAYMAAQHQSRPELQGNQGYGQPQQSYQMRPELAGQQVYAQGQTQQLYGQPAMQQGYPPQPSQPIQEAYGKPIYPPQQAQYPPYQYPATGYYPPPVHQQQPPRAELQGGWQSTPAQGYQELDAGFHAR